jgi:hypothetical protein
MQSRKAGSLNFHDAVYAGKGKPFLLGKTKTVGDFIGYEIGHDAFAKAQSYFSSD